MIGVVIGIGYLTGMVVCGAMTSNRDTLCTPGNLSDMFPHVMISLIWPMVLPYILLTIAMAAVGTQIKKKTGKCKW